MAEKRETIGEALGLDEEEEEELADSVKEAVHGKKKISDIIEEICGKEEKLDKKSVLAGYFLANYLGEGMNAKVIGVIGIVTPKNIEESGHRPGESLAG